MSTAPRLNPEVEKKRIRESIGVDFSKMERLVFGNRVLVAKFIEEKKGSIYVPASGQNESKWQGKIGLVLAVGPAAFEDEPGIKFWSCSVSVGEWVLYRMGDGADMDFCPEGTHTHIPCRMLTDVEIMGVVPRPDFFF